MNFEIDTVPECSYDSISNYQNFGVASKCEFAQNFCGDESTYFKTIELYYCELSESIPIIVLMAIPYIFFCFYWLSSTSENYLEPSVSKLSKIMGFSESLAGVTLIALANGAPDVIACYVASDAEEDLAV